MTNKELAFKLISKIIRDLETRAAVATGAELDRLTKAIEHYRASDAVKGRVAA